MTVQNARIRRYGSAAIAEAMRLIRAGQPVAVATETVYGLAADATNGTAVARIYAAKGRPSFNPLIVHVADLDAARALASFDDDADRLAARWWPGPLTLVLPERGDTPIASLVRAGLSTIAIRVPAHHAIRALIDAAGRPLAAPSANRSGGISPTRASHVIASLADSVPLVIDSGPTTIGIESTIVATGKDGWRLLRPGPISADEITALLGRSPSPAAADAIESPGQLAGHYAPAKPLRLDATERWGHEWLIGFGEIIGDATLSASGDMLQAAANLFDALFEADATPHPAIAIAPIPGTGIGAAINDRLRRAATPPGA